MSLSAEQWRNATTIYQVGRGMGMSNRDIQIALIAAMQESSLRNLNYGDRDSLGLFQQRPSAGWGTPSQVTNPVYASRKFFSTLRGVKNRYNMSMSQAAQAVQRSAYPNAYAKHIGLVRSIWPSVQHRAGDKVQPMSTGAPITGPGSKENITAADLGLGPNSQWYGGKGSDGAVASPGPTNAMGNGLGATDAMALQDPTSAVSAVDTSPLAANYGQPVPAATMIGGIDPNGPQPWATPIGQHTNQTFADAGSFGFAKGVDGWRQAVVQAARGALGTPYDWGGNSLQNGVDCSGLVQQAYARAGKHLPRVSYQQANSGKRVGLNALRPGDLVAWNNSTRNNGADHIAIYIGGGRIIEAPRPGLSVRIRQLGHNEGAWGVHMG